MHVRCGWWLASAMLSTPVAPPMSQTVRYLEKSKLRASASKLPREMPAIAPMNCSRRAGSLYSSSNIACPVCLISFCGSPV